MLRLRRNKAEEHGEAYGDEGIRSQAMEDQDPEELDSDDERELLAEEERAAERIARQDGAFPGRNTEK